MTPWNDEEPSKADVFTAFAEVLKAVSNPRRLELLELMAQGEHSVDALARMSGQGVTTTSAGLQSLRRAGLVATRREGAYIYYRLAGDDVAELYTAAKRVALERYPRMRRSLDEFRGLLDTEVPEMAPSTVTADMLVIDVRPRCEYDAGHFPGALSMPIDEFDRSSREIPEDAIVVLYCRGELCRLAREAAGALRARGIDARVLDEGVVEWRATKEVALDGA
ncbi:MULTISPECIES: ArsR/SmtB family transcription factor [Brachybacterium]|uniref:ArsR/SmtB family transcription factor n=1 Tax=Brachybacterium rhamnosum TaxID=173361 RepID=A0ABW4PYK8_9MICO|nr:metalloregulator ArsR/SmtB family transcription factor [Brachybacterium squillarum]MCW1804484.1 metalloregulator ArsR/SmtB family transcription factor [Brachybacterium squillarum]